MSEVIVASKQGHTQTQSERFEQAAREFGVDLDEDKLKEALRRMKEQPSLEANDEPKQRNDE